MANKVLKIIVEQPSGSRKPFFYNVKSDEEALEIVEMVKEELKVTTKNFVVAEYRINEVKK